MHCATEFLLLLRDDVDDSSKEEEKEEEEEVEGERVRKEQLLAEVSPGSEN